MSDSWVVQNLTPGSFLQYDLTANTECSDADDYPDNPYRCCFYLHHRRFCGLLYAICSSSNKRLNNRSKITVQFFRCIFFSIL